ncbi:MAG: hypothetical protein COV10_04790 [Candidatus Vogelbacteria bacterium CG10_big_fil_rev_8_21_14_0_10_51_16]|uniref:Type II toxin-antitoxin system HicA family toxin n=1 Tax=Candidatus Vogelbacteria bacterium CG10_big_fil_rev_8_21_14_0_10_51_16 TaxID=1975045 RepID=A0A2H0RDH3_9BACT|nr:MAG: hypothetical protein COV10_04790 [Candidatus Vogelbacteria bacterium CG10_big_fil_rev_8_21_14_0_10_51_16]
MSKLPALKPKHAIKILTKLGFTEKRQKGSHKIFENSAGTVFVIAVHGNKELRAGITHELRQVSGLSDDEFLKLLKK